jgi:hypothetical protein
MPYCQPSNIYHPEDDIGSVPNRLTYCRSHRQWHHNEYRCPYEPGDPFRYLSDSRSRFIQPYRRDVTGAWVSDSAPLPQVFQELPGDSEDSPEREELPLASELDLIELYRSSPPSRRSMDSEFRNYLRTLVCDPDEIDNVEFCADCRDPAWADELIPADNGRICESCRENYSDCSSCEELFADGYLTETLSEDHVCQRCLGDYYSYCDYCEGYYPDDYSCDHDHDQGSGCCESPQLEFTIRNDGAEPLANDTRVAFTLPAGVISPAGLRAIRDYLCDSGHYDLTYGIEVLGDQWQTRTGNYAKRLSRYAYQTHQAKLTPEIMSQIGTIARDHSKPVEVEIEVTREFNESAAYFYHEDSCYWGSYYESRCALKTNGAFGLRSFRGGAVSGRAWVMPLRHVDRLRTGPDLTPTFDTMGADAFVVFNGYGDLGGYAASRIVAHMAGWTYRKIGFGCDPMYINAGGYLVAPEHIAEPYTDGSLKLSVPQHSDLYESEKVNA